jgi:hypothetical protein
MVALCVVILGVSLVALLWLYPQSLWLWGLTGIVLLFVIVVRLDPRYRYWRRASICFGIASTIATVPSIIAKAKIDGLGAFEFLSDSSPLIVLGFLGTGLFLAWLDWLSNRSTTVTTAAPSTTPNVHSSPSSNNVMGLTAGGNIVVNQGISEDTFLAVVDALRISAQVQASTSIKPSEEDEDLVWRLIEDLKLARQKLERDLVGKLLAALQKSFERNGSHWSKRLRTESILIMAEEEKVTIARLREQGKQVDLTRLQKLRKELSDA